MTIKNMLMLTGVLAGAYYLRDKGRRDRLMSKARGAIDKAKTRATELADKAESKGAEAMETLRRDTSTTGASSNGTSGYDSFGNYR